MIDYSNSWFIKLRSFGRSLGVLRPAVIWYRKLLKSGYEERFDSYMMSRIQPQDIVWDIGANIGHFTERFLHAVGREGVVVAFEPSPTAQMALKSRFDEREHPNAVIECLALGDKDGTVSFWHSTDVGQSVTDGLGFKEGATSSEVKMVMADSYIKDHPSLVPNCIKIDVEGFESDVLKGMDKVLKQPHLRAIFVEVHFEQSARRGLANAPAVVVDILNRNGFSIKWVDPSHITAERAVL